jgi:hypothetical protein
LPWAIRSRGTELQRRPLPGAWSGRAGAVSSRELISGTPSSLTSSGPPAFTFTSSPPRTRRASAGVRPTRWTKVKLRRRSPIRSSPAPTRSCSTQSSTTEPLARRSCTVSGITRPEKWIG